MFEAIQANRIYLREWLPFVDKTRKIADTEAFISAVLSGADPVFTIWYDGGFAGLIGFKDYDPDNHKAEIGYWLKEDKQGHGIISQSVEVLLGYGFETMSLNRIQIKVAVQNVKSKRVPERLGFKLEGIERDGELLFSREYTDLMVYSKLKKEMPLKP